MSNTFSVGSSLHNLQCELQAEFCGAGAQAGVWSKKPWTANPFHKKGAQGPGAGQGTGHSETEQEPMTPDFLVLRTPVYKSQAILWLGSLLGGTQLKLLFVVFLFSYFTITSRCLRLCYGIDPVRKTWSDSVSGVNVHLHPSSGVWEWLPEWFLNGWTGKSPNSKIHVYVCIYICIYLYMQDTHTVLHRCYVFYIYKYVCMCIRSFVSILKLNISQSLCDNEKKKALYNCQNLDV